MEKGLFGTICGIIGAVIGGVGTYFVTKNKLENDIKSEYEASFNKAQEELKQHYETNYLPKKEPIKDSILAKAMPASGAKMGEKSGEKAPTAEDKLRAVDDVEPENYAGFYQLKPEDKVESDGSEYEFYEEYGGPDNGKFPKIITRKEYEEPNGYVKLKLTYYEESAVFAHTGDSTNSGFTEDYFGLQNLSEFGNPVYDDEDSDGYTLWFRSDTDGTDFQVYYEPNETYDEVLAKEGALV